MDNPPGILLLGNDPADKQWSMLQYGKQLHREIGPLLGGKTVVSLAAPDTSGLDLLRRWRAGRAAATYWSRYIAYPSLLRERRHRGPTHILDQGNSWLITRLDPGQTVITCHDLIPLVLRQRYRSLLPALSSRAYAHIVSELSKARFIITNSECTRRDVIQHLGYPGERIQVIPLGIDGAFRAAQGTEEVLSVRRELGLPSGEKLLLHAGHNVFYKNIEGLLEEFAALIRRGRKVRLVRAGTRLSPAQRELARKLNVEKSLIELGPLPPDRMAAFYRAGDLFAYPSWYEGQGLPPLEAMACGVPVVVSNRGALPEMVGEAGLVADPDKSGALAGAFEKILDDDGLHAELRRKGLERARSFSWRQAAEKTIEVYGRIFHLG